MISETSTESSLTLKGSVLIVSRTTEILNRLLRSLDHAYLGEARTIEVLVSWNGSKYDVQHIHKSRLPVAITHQEPYHFASNMNRLASRSKGRILLFANDDLIADPGSVDAAIDRLTTRPEIGIIGSRLRTSDGQLAHAGIHFNHNGSPYHQLEGLANDKHPANYRECFVPAITGAFFAMRTIDFLKIRFCEDYRAYGEDVQLCLDTRRILKKRILYCPAMSGIHDAESTRRLFQDQGANEDDQGRLRKAWLSFIEQCDRDDLLLELTAAQTESEELKSHQRCRIRALETENKNLVETLKKEKESSARIKALQRAMETKAQLRHALIESENGRLRSRIQQLENQLGRESFHEKN